MTTFQTILNILIILVFFSVLFYMQKKFVSFSKRVFLGLGVGIVFGLALQFIYGPESEVVTQSIAWFNLAGNGYIKLLQMVVMPLVFVSILSAFTKAKITNDFGKIGGFIIAMLVGTTAIAASVGIIASLSFDLQSIEMPKGEAENTKIAELEQTMGDLENLPMPQKILELLPGNPFLDLTGARPTSTIAVVIFAAFLGMAYLGVKRKNPEQGEMFSKLTDAIHVVIMRVVTLVLRLTPYGVLALMTKVTATSDLNAIWNLGEFVVASYLALLVMFGIHLLIISLTGLNPLTYIRKIMPVLVFAFSSRSSAGTLPLNVKTQQEGLGVPEGIANFAGSFGITIGQNGCAGIYPAMLAVMVAPSVGIDPLSVSFILNLIAVVAISSFGVAGVGGGATFAALIVLSTMNLPVGIVGLLISIEPLIDMARTAVNVSGSMTAGVVTSKVTKQLNTSVYKSEIKSDVSSAI
ncbi:L-cystine transporter [Bacillus sp. PK3_68]|uniref:L-cystine transporter n=1 Tax=Bacillus sp. PK3_68 TaxID=2027408 RepID=UPI00217DDDFC|nr:L-cystine transporter [Bacillus sp. PK3_68]